MSEKSGKPGSNETSDACVEHSDSSQYSVAARRWPPFAFTVLNVTGANPEHGSDDFFFERAGSEK